MSMAKRKGHSEKAKKRAISTFAVLCAVLGIGVVLTIKGYDLKERRDAFAQEQKVYESLIAQEEERKADLEEEEKHVQSTQYVEEIARTKLRLLYPDEVVFVNESEDENE